VITGILPVDKPLGWTSHDVVARARRVAGQKQVGHAGTLDPLATGVLLLVLGQATRLSAYLMDAPKEYRAVVVLGATTATDDAEAPLLERCDISHIGRAEIDVVLPRFRGVIQQAPPRYAAVRKDGEKLYVLARRGEEVEIESREVTIHAIAVEEWNPPALRLRVRCGSGTYIRSLARDIGAALGAGGYLHALRRTVSGSFDARHCAALDHIQDRPGLLRALVPPDRAVVEWPAVIVGPDDAAAIATGRTIALAHEARGSVRIYSEQGHLIALAEGDGDVLRPFRVFTGGPDETGQ
jgi:tRNA pseudouridine55 synthase